MSTAVAEPAPANTETETAEPNFDAVAESTFNAIKNNEPQAEPEPEPKAPATKPAEKPTKEGTKAEPAKPDRVAIPEKLVGDEPDPATPPAEEDAGPEPPAGMSKKGEANWSVMRETNRALKAELKAEKQRSEQLKTAKPPVDEKTAEELKTLKQVKADYEQRLNLFAVEKSDDFLKLTGKENKAIERAKATLKDAGADAMLAELGAKLPVGRRLKLLAENIEDIDVRHSVSDDLKEVDRIADEKAELLENSKTKAGEYSATQKAAAERARDQKMEENSVSFRQKFEELQKQLKGFRKSADGKATDWDANVDGRIAMLKNIGKAMLSEHMTPEQSADLAELIATSLEMEVLEDDLKYSKEELKKARAELARLKPAQPTVGHATVEPASNDASQLTPDQLAEAEFNRALATTGAR